MTAKTKTERFRRLLSHGYFAPELPPCFVSEDLAKYRSFIYNNILSLPPEKGKPAFHRYISEPSWFYFPRFGKDDRRHGVTNPIAHLLLSKIIADNYIKISQSARKSKISASRPIFDWTGSRAIARSSVDVRDDFRVDLSARREMYVSADIRAFFHSIYVHSIPWSIYGKAWAKKNRDSVHYGNLIDLICRNAQGGQTIGLPVGPDTSRLLAELVASAVDLILQNKISTSQKSSSRYVDDYTISSDSSTSGESLISALRQSLFEFELELNNDKSEIHSTAKPQNTGWKQAVRSRIPKGAPNRADMQHFFYEIAQICGSHSEINVEKFALQNARNAFIKSSDWKYVQNLIISAYRRNSSLIQILVEIFILRDAEKGDLDVSSLDDFLEYRIPFLATQNRTGEIIWLLFMAIRLNLVLDAKILSPIYEIDNALIAVLIATARSKGNIRGSVNFSVWNRHLNADGLRSSLWLYAYEAAATNIIPNHSSTSFIENDKYFSFLFKKNVRFLNISSGFLSLRSVMNELKSANNRISMIRSDFSDDFDLDITDFDEENDVEEADNIDY